MENAPRSTQRRIRYTNTTRALAWLMTTALVAAVVLLVSSAAAAGTKVEVSIDTIHRGDPSDLFHEATIEAVGACTATLRYKNNEEASDHPDTDILVGPVTFPDVEHGPFMEPDPLTFTGTGPTEVATRIGGDGVSSGGFILEVTCTSTTTTTVTPSSTTTTTEVPQTTTTVAGPTTTTSIPESSSSTTSSTEPPITTTEPPPINGPETGGGACAEGACDGDLVTRAAGSAPIAAWTPLSPLTTWLLLGAGLAGVAALGLLVIMGGQRTQDPPYE